MYKEGVFYICNHCQNIVEAIEMNGVSVDCCGEKLQELKANVSDAAEEKHVPEVSIENNTVTVKVGSISHPMLEEHHIAWAYIKTNKKVARAKFELEKDPVAVFSLLPDEKVLEVYAYCNLHGLWKKEV